MVATGTLGAARFAMVHASVHPAWSLGELTRRAGETERVLGGDDLEASLALLAGDDRFAQVADVLGRLTRCRSVTRDGAWSAASPGRSPDLLPWHEPWQAAGHDYGVVYGHWALQGRHVAKGLRGLDTGCVHDGSLTAWLPDPDGHPFPAIDDRFWQVRARRRYFRDDAAPLPG